AGAGRRRALRVALLVERVPLRASPDDLPEHAAAPGLSGDRPRDAPADRGRAPAPPAPGGAGGSDPRVKGPATVRWRRSGRIAAALACVLGIVAGACGKSDDGGRAELTFSASLAEDERPTVREVLDRFRAESGVAVAL